MECEPLFNSDDRPSPGMKEKATEAQAVKIVTWRMPSVVLGEQEGEQDQERGDSW